MPEPDESSMTAAAYPECSACVLVFWLPSGRAFGDQIEEMPHAAEIVAGRERRIGNAHELAGLALEHRNSWGKSVLAGVAHVARKARAMMRHHRKFPAAAFSKFA